MISNVEVVNEEEPSGSLLSLSHGIPLTRRNLTYVGALPEKIAIYRGPLQAFHAATLTGFVVRFAVLSSTRSRTTVASAMND
jgi:predicted Zn-dependent protease with MMP-like domain